MVAHVALPRDAEHRLASRDAAASAPRLQAGERRPQRPAAPVSPTSGLRVAWDARPRGPLPAPPGALSGAAERWRARGSSRSHSARSVGSLLAERRRGPRTRALPADSMSLCRGHAAPPQPCARGHRSALCPSLPAPGCTGRAGLCPAARQQEQSLLSATCTGTRPPALLAL